MRTFAHKIRRKILSIVKVDKTLTAAEKRKLLKLPRYEITSTKVFGRGFKLSDAQTFLGSYQEIFKDEIYKFSSASKDIIIIDCGANVGLSTLYFKMNFPNAKVIAFEPDPNIFDMLKYNMASFGLEDVVCRNEAISNSDTVLNFWLEGGHSGMIIEGDSNKKSVQVKAVRLKNVLKEFDHITFLKIDIEGEETKVMPDIAEELHKVEFLFLEYHSFIGSYQNLDLLLKIISQAGMRYHVESAITKQFPFINEEIFLNMDMLLNIFCYRK